MQAARRKSRVFRELSRQLLRSGTSIGANLEEAQAAQSRADFCSKCNIALKETRETCYWLRLVSEFDNRSEIPQLREEAREIGRVPGAIIVSARRNTAER
jgi:four helix bundle protein